MLFTSFARSLARITLLVLGLAATALPAQAANFSILDLYSADGVNSNIRLLDSLGDYNPGANAVFTSDPDSATFVNSLSSGVLYGWVTCDEPAICGAGSRGYFNRRAPTGSTTISAVTFVAETGSPLHNFFNTTSFLVVIGNAATYQSNYINGTTVSASANATGTAIAEQLDAYFGISAAATVSTISSASAAEGTNLVHTVTLSAATTAVQSFTLTLTNQTTSASDYGALSFSNGVTLSGSTLSVPSGVSSFTITVAGAQDYLVESNETYQLALGGVTATGTITDDDVIAFHAEKTSVFSDVDNSGGPSAGDRLGWTITVFNDGTVPLGGLRIASDTMRRADNTTISGFGAADFAPASIASLTAGNSASFTASYTLTNTDIDKGGVRNSASVGATPSGGNEIFDTTDDGDDTDGNTVDDASEFLFTAPAGIALVKTATLHDDDGTPGVSAGDTIAYVFTVTNTGTVTLTNVTVSDPKVIVSGGPLASLAAGASDTTSFTASYTLTQADVDAGSVSNTATVTAKDPSNAAVNDTSGTAPGNDSATVTPLAANAGIALVKTATLHDDDGTPGVSAGDTIAYAFTVTNTGTVTLTDVSVSDPKVTVSGGPLASLAAGASDTTSFTASYTLTQADVDAGSVSNTATVSAKDPSNAAVSDTSGTAPGNDNATVTPLTASAGIALVKTATLHDDDGTPGVSAGDTIAYAFTVTNTGAVTLTNVTVSDPKVIVSGGPLASLAAGASDTTSFTASYTLTQADVDAGSVSNTATVTAKDPSNAAVSDTSGTAPGNDTATVTPLAANAGIALVKTATLHDDDGTPGVSAGDTIAYAFTVTNTGTVTLTDVTITDPKVTVSGGPLASLAAGASDTTSFTASYTLTQADVDAGSVSNTATVSAKDPSNAAVSDTSGTAPGNDSATVTPLAAHAGIALVKTATLHDDDGTPGVSAGDTIAYAFTVTNTGTVTLTNVTVSDPKVTVSGGPLASLAAGASDATSFTASYTLTQADVDAGSVSNTATVSAKDPTNAAVSDTSGTAPENDNATVMSLAANAGIALVKTATLLDDDGTPGVSAGDTIAYAFTVTNTGAVTLTNVTVTDPLVTVGGAALASLAPGASDSATFSAHYAVTAGDVLLGYVSNQATAEGTFGAATQVADLSGTARDNDAVTVTFLGSIGGSVANMSGLVAGAIVKLIDATTGALIAEVTTDAQGKYSFIGLKPGEFCVSFEHSENEAVLATTGTSKGADANGDEVCGITIVPGENNAVTGIDAVMVDPSGVIYDAVTRSPIEGATVTLLFNGAAVPDSWLASTGDANNVVTGADGLYSFLLQSPAQSGTYTLQVTAPGYETSTLLPAQTSALVPAIGLGVEAVVPFSSAPATGQETTHYLAFVMSFPDWTNSAALSKGVIHNHIPLDPAGVATALRLTKTADVSDLSSPAQVGDVIRYTITAENGGALPLTAPVLDDPLTTDEALVTKAGVSDDGVLDPGETWVWTATVTLDAQLLAQKQIDNLATLTGVDAWGGTQELESSPTGNETFGAGNGTATVVALDGLIDEIRLELREILRDDLEETLARLSDSFSGYSKGAAARLRAGVPEGCPDPADPDSDLTVSIANGQMTANGGYAREHYDCQRREWRIDTLEFSGARRSGFGTQALFSYTHRLERMPDEMRLNGRFFGVYGSHSAVSAGTAEGAINGLGLFGGIYGARRIAGEGMFDYYLGAAAGRHSFSFDFARALTIHAKGDYSYFAVLAGGALSRQYRTDRWLVTPRLGLDLAYAPSANVSVTATQGVYSETGGFGLGAVGNWRLFLETEFSNALREAENLPYLLTLTPSLLCEGGIEQGSACGFGLGLGLFGQDADEESQWSAEIDASATRARHTVALELSYTRKIEQLRGALSTGLMLEDGQRPVVTLALDSRF
ncbi:beta strand repeat-containing protein [Rhodobacter lacus]|uniref:Beta strand repeat-containing protein n=1 Tax=Rhodobacter lacus TaxID=1641972 RepID=A0ABW5A7F0_9RHOB